MTNCHMSYTNQKIDFLLYVMYDLMVDCQIFFSMKLPVELQVLGKSEDHFCVVQVAYRSLLINTHQNGRGSILWKKLDRLAEFSYVETYPGFKQLTVDLFKHTVDYYDKCSRFRCQTQ